MKHPLFTLSVFFSAGIYFAQFIPFHYVWIVGFIALALLALLPFIFHSRYAVYLLMFSFILAGMALFDIKMYFPPAHRIDQRVGTQSQIRVQGQITRNFSNSGKSVYILQSLRLFDKKREWQDVKGSLLLKQGGECSFKFIQGDFIDAWGEIVDFPLDPAKPKEGYPAWLRSEGIALILEISEPQEVSILKDRKPGFMISVLNGIRQWCSENLTRGVQKNTPESALMQAMFLGIRQDLDPTIKNAFLYTNTIHILSISGLHLTVILMAVLIVLGLFSVPRRWVFGVTFVCVWIYALLTGLDPPILRSAIMASFAISGGIILKKTDLVNSLGGSALVMLGANPFYLFDTGFQLSFLCLITLAFLTPIVEQDLKSLMKFRPDVLSLLTSPWDRRRFKMTGQIITAVSGSIAVWIGVTPLISYHFHVFSPITVLANLVAIPLVGIIMNLGFVSCLAGFIPWISVSLNNVTEVLLNLLTRITEMLSNLPGGYFFVEAPTWEYILIYYGIIFLGTFAAGTRIKPSLFFCSTFLLIPLIVPVVRPDIMKIQLISRDHAEMILIESLDWEDALFAKGEASFSGSLKWLDRLPLLTRVKNVANVYSGNDSKALLTGLSKAWNLKNLNRPLKNQTADKYIGFDRDYHLDRIQYDANWILWVNKDDSDKLFLKSTEGSGVVVLSDRVGDVETLLKGLDHLSMMGVINFDLENKDLVEKIRARGIPVFSPREGGPIVLELDGKSMWIDFNSRK